MTWGEFKELFMGKFFPSSARHAKAWEFLELKQGNMTVLEYVAKFTELARFGDDMWPHIWPWCENLRIA